MSGTIINGGEVHSIIANGKEVIQANLGKEATFDGTMTQFQFVRDIKLEEEAPNIVGCVITDRKEIVVLDVGRKDFRFYDLDGRFLRSTYFGHAIDTNTEMRVEPILIKDENDNMFGIFSKTAICIDQVGNILFYLSLPLSSHITDFGNGYFVVNKNHDNITVYNLKKEVVLFVQSGDDERLLGGAYDAENKILYYLTHEGIPPKTKLTRNKNGENEIIDILPFTFDGYTANENRDSSTFSKKNIAFFGITRDSLEKIFFVYSLDKKQVIFKDTFERTNAPRSVRADKFGNFYAYNREWNSHTVKKVNRHGQVLSVLEERTLERLLDRGNIGGTTYDGYFIQIQGLHLEKLVLYRNRSLNGLNK